MAQYGMTGAVVWLLTLMLPVTCLAHPGELRPLAEADHFRHPMHDRFYTESWSYHLMAATGEVLSLSYVFSNIGVTSGSAGVQFAWARPGGEPIILKDQRSQAEFVADRKAGSIAIGPHSMIVQGDVTRLIFSAQGVSADLTLRAWMPGFQIGDGMTVINKDKGQFNRMFIEIPRGDFDGSVTLHGATQRVKGAVFMDHTLSNVLATSYSRYWYTLRAFFPDHTAIFVGFRYRPEAGGGRWDLGYVTDRNSILGVSTDCLVEPNGGDPGTQGSAMPTAFAVGLSGEDIQLQGTYQNAELYSTTPVLENLNWLVRRVAMTFAGNPMIYRFRSHASLFLQKSGDTLHLEGPAYQAVVTMKN